MRDFPFMDTRESSVNRRRKSTPITDRVKELANDQETNLYTGWHGHSAKTDVSQSTSTSSDDMFCVDEKLLPGLALLLFKDVDQFISEVSKISVPTERISLPIPETPTRFSPSDILTAIEEEPLEDGYTHPAEEMIRAALAENRLGVIEWFKRTIPDEGNSSLAADLIKCVGRLYPNEVNEWGINLTRIALRSPDIEVRDAAVQALELWATPSAADLLHSHEESEPWLQEYIGRVVKEIA